MVKPNHVAVLSFVLILAFSGCVQQPSSVKPGAGQHAGQPANPSRSLAEGVEVTVYNSNLGVVKEVKSLDLKDGAGSYSMEGVASQIDPTSVKLTSADGSFSVLEQNYQYDLVGRQKLLEKYLGKTVTGYKVLGRTKEPVEGTLLSSSGSQMILKTGNGSVEIVDVNDLNLPALPEGLQVKPTLMWLIENKGAGNKTAELSYMTSGMSWDADYILVADKDDAKMDFNGWVTITNNAGTTFKDVALKLVAGDVNRAVPQPVLDGKLLMKKTESLPTEQFAEQQLFEYHMYDLQRTTTLKDKEQKQISLLSAEGARIDKEYVYEGQGGWNYYGGSGNQKVQVKLNFNNTEANGLGMPLPKGTVRVFKADADGKLQFLGEDSIDHTPKDETLRILVGDAFDVVGQRKQMKVNQLGSCQYSVTWEDTLRNHKGEDIKVTVLEDTSWDWTITSENYPHITESNQKIRWNLPVKANGESKLTYTIRYKYC